MQLTSLTLDGLTGVVQEKMRSECRTQSHHMMCNVNLWSILYLFISKSNCKLEVLDTDMGKCGIAEIT